MRILLQLVSSASVEISSKTVASIGRGFLLLVGMKEGDDEILCRKMIEKICKLRVFPDENGKTNLSLSQVGGQILAVSQFTLYADCREGNRPSFVKAMPVEEARALYPKFVDILHEYLPDAQSGVFQADMKVHLVNDGPFTLMLDSDEVIKS